MNKEKDVIENFHRAIKVFDAQRRVLVNAGCTEVVMRTYGDILRYLKHLPRDTVLDILSGSHEAGSAKASSVLPIPEPEVLSLEQIEKFVKDDATPRKVLETIAVERFRVPRGSLRSFSSTSNLRAKIITMVENERAHATISALARHTEG